MSKKSASRRPIPFWLGLLFLMVTISLLVLAATAYIMALAVNAYADPNNLETLPSFLWSIGGVATAIVIVAALAFYFGYWVSRYDQ
jgi:heme/copper-type cytochrome/quinol oxidase subunit 2